MKRALALLLLLPAGALTACESTQEKSARLAREAPRLQEQTGVEVARRNPHVEVTTTAVLHDANGTAVVVGVRNTTARPLANLPVAIAVRDAGGRMAFRNDEPGLETSLTHIAYLPPHGRADWVNDQVAAAGEPRTVTARIGDSGKVSARPPRIVVQDVRLGEDPVDGPFARAVVVNRSASEQRRLVILGVARRGSRVVAAGRSLIEQLAPGKRSRFRMFFIGDPRGATLSLTPAPTVTPTAPK
jgi:hypothetical protein